MKLNEIVPYELARILYQKGFSHRVRKHYNIYNKFTFDTEMSLHSEAIWAPTWDEVRIWLHDKFGITVRLTEEAIYQTVVELSI